MDSKTKMETRINLEKQNKSNDQITELNLDNCQAPQISGLTDDFINLETLSMINVGLTTLKGFPKLPKLKKLELSDNRITCGLNLLQGCPKLQHLNLSGNRIKDLEALDALKEFKELINLDLFNCEVTKTVDYRKKVFQLLPNLRALDGYDQNDCEVKSDDEEILDEDDYDESEEEAGIREGVEGDNDDDEDDDDDDDDDADVDADEDDDDDNDDDDDADDDDDEDDEDDADEEYDSYLVDGNAANEVSNEADEEDDDDDDDEDDENDDEEDFDDDENSSSLKQTDRGVKRKHDDAGDEPADS